MTDEHNVTSPNAVRQARYRKRRSTRITTLEARVAELEGQQAADHPQAKWIAVLQTQDVDILDTQAVVIEKKGKVLTIYYRENGILDHFDVDK